MAGEVTFKIVEFGAVLSTERQSGWAIEINKVSWNGNTPKWEVRPWNEDHSKCGKGVGLKEEELVALGEFIEQQSQKGF